MWRNFENNMNYNFELVTIDKITIGRETDKAYFELSYKDDNGFHKVEFNTFLAESDVTAERTDYGFINSAVKLPMKKLEIK